MIRTSILIIGLGIAIGTGFMAGYCIGNYQEPEEISIEQTLYSITTDATMTCSVNFPDPTITTSIGNIQ